MSEGFVALVAIGTLAAVLTRPWGVREGPWSRELAGGLLQVLTGRLQHTPRWTRCAAWRACWLFWSGCSGWTLAANRAGLFERAARLTVRAAGGDGRRLLAAVFVLGTLTTAVLSNDATVVLVTPVILSACRALELPPLPYLLACTFVADTASSLLPISNPINLLYAEQLDLRFGRHALLLGAPTLLAVVVNAGIFHLLFRAQLPRRFNAGALLDTPLTPATRADRLIVGGLALVALA